MSIEKRLQAIEDALTPKPGSIAHVIWWRNDHRDMGETVRLTDTLGNTWTRTDDETVEEFKQRVLDEIRQDCPPGCVVMLYEHATMEAEHVTD